MNTVMFDTRDEDEQNINFNYNTMTKEEAEDYRYGYGHTIKVNDKELRARKVSNCGGWMDLQTGHTYENDSVTVVRVDEVSISKSKIKL